MVPWLGRRTRLRRCLALVALATALGLAGCGGAEPSTARLSLWSPAAGADGVLQPAYRCGGGSLWVPLEWGSIPSGTKELAIYIGRYKYLKEGGQRRLIVPFADLVSHVDPSLPRQRANFFPSRGASWSTFGVSCPPVRRGQHIMLAVFALDRSERERRLTPALAARLTKEALAGNPTSGEPRAPGALTEDASAIGHLLVTYGQEPPKSG